MHCTSFFVRFTDAITDAFNDVLIIEKVIGRHLHGTVGVGAAGTGLVSGDKTDDDDDPSIDGGTGADFKARLESHHFATCREKHNQSKEEETKKTEVLDTIFSAAYEGMWGIMVILV